ncbi:MAG: hypothetical protein WCJ35_27420, partial [Planctomycetota bacterium]
GGNFVQSKRTNPSTGSIVAAMLDWDRIHGSAGQRQFSTRVENLTGRDASVRYVIDGRRRRPGIFSTPAGWIAR